MELLIVWPARGIEWSDLTIDYDVRPIGIYPELGWTTTLLVGAIDHLAPSGDGGLTYNIRPVGNIS